jgi:Arc/MetJ family transcription regulator
MADESMRINIVIDDFLMERAMKLAGFRSKRETVESGLKLLIQLSEQVRIRKARGKLRWRGNLDATRRDT